VAAARETLLMAYLTAQPTMSLTYAARFDEPETVGPPGREQRTGPGGRATGARWRI